MREFYPFCLKHEQKLQNSSGEARRGVTLDETQLVFRRPNAFPARLIAARNI